MSITMEDPIGSYWSMKSHKNKTDEIVRLATRVKTLEDALRAYMFCEQTNAGKNPHRVGTNRHRAFELGRQALTAKEPKS